MVSFQRTMNCGVFKEYKTFGLGIRFAVGNIHMPYSCPSDVIQKYFIKCIHIIH